MLGDDQISNLRVIGNYMNGGNFTINGGSSGNVDSAFYSGNHFGRDFKYGVAGNINSASTWDATQRLGRHRTPRQADRSSLPAQGSRPPRLASGPDLSTLPLPLKAAARRGR